MATKKKKVTKQVSKLAFNKKNMLALADKIYSEKGGVITALKLCEGTLVNGKDGGRTTHCAVGEAYYYFVNPSFKSVKNKGDATTQTDVAIEALVKVAQLKKDTEDNRESLRLALNDAVIENDAADADTDAGTYTDRAAKVAEVFRNDVAPLLK